MSAKKKLQLLGIFFVLLWVLTTVIFGGIFMGLNLIVPIFSTPRLILGVTILCFAMSVLFMVVKFEDIVYGCQIRRDT